MKTMIVTFYGVPPEMTPGDLRRLLADSLEEFVTARSPSAEEYVERQFPLPANEPDRLQLVRDVEAGRRWARHLQDNGFRVMEYTPPDVR